MKVKDKILFMGMMFLLFAAILTLANNVSAQEKDSDLDGIPDETDRYPFDYDNDGMPDIWEKKHDLRYDKDDANEDPDGDGVRNIDEYKEGTDPGVSEKTKERVQRTFLSPVEIVMARILVWLGVGLFILLLIVVILRWINVFDILHFVQILSKKLFRREGIEKAAIPKYVSVRRPVLHPGYPPMPPPKRPVLHPRYLQTPPPRRPVLPPRYPHMPPQRRPVLHPGHLPIPPQEVVKKQPKQKVFIQQRLRPPLRAVPAQRSGIKAKEETGRPVKEPVHTIEGKAPRKFFAYVEKKKDRDVFGKLSEHIHDYKSLKSDNEDSLKKLAKL